MVECSCLNIAPQCLMQGVVTNLSEFRKGSVRHCCNIETLVMEFQIKTLAQHFEELARAGVSAVLKLHQALLAAQHAIELLFRLHSKGFIHRDIKPENLMYNVRYTYVGVMMHSTTLTIVVLAKL